MVTSVGKASGSNTSVSEASGGTSREELLLSENFSSFSVDNGLSDDLLDNWVDKDFLNNGLFEDFVDNFLSFLEVGLERVLFSDNGEMLLFNESSVLLVDDWLMVLVDVLFVDDGLVVLMDDVLVMFVNDILLVFNENVLVMLVDDILMDFLNNWCSAVGLGDSDFVSSEKFLSFVE